MAERWPSGVARSVDQEVSRKTIGEESSVKLRMGPDMHENDSVTLFPKDCPQIATNVDAPAAGEGRIHGMISEQGMESVLRKQF